ncbi:MAG: AmmeMemoRadiSam system protein B [Candidatus ainarchaeum sp.]|nr:AmmeMemoRadiSam system protein B [Candidatus ainarchaeum sp.]
MNIREPAVKGIFYPAKKEALEKQLTDFFKKTGKSGKKSFAIIAPHAGYQYSGQTAAIAFSELQKAETIILLGPNHTGLGKQIAISEADYWETPLGKIRVDSELRKKLLQKLGIEADDSAHIQEHSIEVQLPFIQFLFPEAKILPICIMENRLEELKKLGNALAEICSEKKSSIVASSDFSHFLPLENAMEKDLKAIEFIKKIDVEGFYKEVEEKNLSICGFCPITATMQYCRKKKLKKASLLKYDSSATATGDKSKVVGYAAIKFEV